MFSSTGMKDDLRKAVEIVADAGGEVVGRTRLQKMAYLLEAAGVGVGFDFEYRHYGPYSEQLANAASAAGEAGLLSVWERPTTWGGFYSIYQGKKSEREIPEPRRNLLNIANSSDPVALELAATAVYLASEEGSEAPWEETAARKPEKAEFAMQKAKDLYKELLDADISGKLPRIL